MNIKQHTFVIELTNQKTLIPQQYEETPHLFLGGDIGRKAEGFNLPIGEVDSRNTTKHNNRRQRVQRVNQKSIMNKLNHNNLSLPIKRVLGNLTKKHQPPKTTTKHNKMIVQDKQQKITTKHNNLSRSVASGGEEGKQRPAHTQD